ncbi:MAG: DNA internalization-related competence protein ComEC/Rec2 [Planctomycetaceae bacterium]|nr:DNA internalization-related competence protein ComEC/Rec2 [Planctomycetaceae bacterium]
MESVCNRQSVPLPDCTSPTISIPVVCLTAIVYAVGTAAGSLLSATAFPVVFLLSGIALIVLTICSLSTGRRLLLLNICLLLLAAARSGLSQPGLNDGALQRLVRGDAPIVRMTGRIVSTPVANDRPVSTTAPRLFGLPSMTRFQLQTQTLRWQDRDVAVHDQCLVTVEGDLSGKLFCGDRVRLIGRVDWPQSPGNPGEFDYRSHLARRGLDVQIFVSQPEAVVVLTKAARWMPGVLIGSARNELKSILSRNLPSEIRGIAMALLLGDRNELPTETEDAFVASGTMHLLAISGLHVGILCLFVMRLLNLLLVRRRPALIFTLTICVLYALLTDFRPSVVRATVFFGIFVAGQLAGRDHQMVHLLSITALLMLMVQPSLIFDTGAWLSFMAVAALGWVSVPTVETNDRPPPEALTWTDHLREWSDEILGQVIRRYRQMLAILFLTTPLVASTFHVISPVGLIINLLLIPYAGVVLGLGFLTLIVGALLPLLVAWPATLFSAAVSLMLDVVEFSSQVKWGHIFIADLPDWFLPSFYTLVLGFVVFRTARLRRSFLVTIGVLTGIAVGSAVIPPSEAEVRVTVLDVGHGNATVIETGDGRVFVVDAGAMNRGERTADVISRFLWHRGYSRIEGLLVSHADLDHYNAVGGLLNRMPVGRFLVSAAFLSSPEEPVQATAKLAATRSVVVQEVADLELLQTPRIRIHVFAPDGKSLDNNADDNQTSLVVVVEAGRRRIVIPGDSDGNGARSIFSRIGPCDVLLSPHHGAVGSNNAAVNQWLAPDFVIVSCRDSANRKHLSRVYPDAQQILYTFEEGAVTIQVKDDGTLLLTGHRV